MRRKTDPHSHTQLHEGSPEERLPSTAPLAPDTHDPPPAPGLVVSDVPPGRPASRAFKFLGKETAAALTRAAAVALVVVIWLALGNPNLGEVLQAVRPYWDEFGVALAGFLVGILVCLPRLVAGRRAIKRDAVSAAREQAAVRRDATSDERRQREIYRAVVLRALPQDAKHWLRQDPIPKTWLRHDTVTLEEIAAGDSPLCAAWGQTRPEELRRILVDAVSKLWGALGPPVPSPEHPTVMVAAEAGSACTEHFAAVSHAYQQLTDLLDTP